MKTSESVKEIMPALLSVTDSMQAEKDGKNPHFRSDYMTLDGILNTVKPILKDVGIVIFQSVDSDFTSDDDQALLCTTRLVHESGEYIECHAVVHADKMTPQGYGSAITYARRYSICTALGIAEVDDDGNAAEAASAPKKPVTKSKAKPKQTSVVKTEEKTSIKKDNKLSEEVVDSIIAAFDAIKIEIWDLEKVVGAHSQWTESTRTTLLAQYDQIKSGNKTIEQFKEGD